MSYREKMSELAIADALEYTERIINAVHDPLIILYGDLMVALANNSFYQTFAVVPEETEEQFFYELGNGQWDIKKLRHMLDNVLPKNESFESFKVEHNFPVIGKRVMSLNACRFVMASNRTKLIIITLKDITDHNMIDKLRRKVAVLEKKLKDNAVKSN